MAQLVAQGANATEAAREAYPDAKYPGQVGYKAMKDPRVQEAISTYKEHFDKKFTDEYMVRKAKDLMEAEVDGNPHHAIQQKQWEAVAKLKGYYGDQSQKHLHLHGDKDILEKMYSDLDNGILEQ